MIEVYSRCTTCHKEKEQGTPFNPSDENKFECTTCATEYCIECSSEPHRCDSCGEAEICDQCMATIDTCGDCIDLEDEDEDV